jgi:hypothetical protein
MNTIRFLRARNCAGCDVYICPYAGNQNAGYLLVDLDTAGPAVLDRMHAAGLAPCVVLQTSPGHLQAWMLEGAILALDTSSSDRFGPGSP